MPKISILQNEVAYQGKYQIRKVELRYQDQAVDEIQKREVFNRGNAVAALLYNTQTQKLLFVNQFRVAPYLVGHGVDFLEVCAGTIEENENPEETMLREIEEETGYFVKAIEHAFSLFVSPGASTERIHCYVATYTDSDKMYAGGGLAEESEHIENVELTVEETLKAIQSGRLSDAKSVALVQYAQLKGII